VRVRDINPGALGSLSSLFFISYPLGGELVFAADGGATGVELWRTDGTAAGTVLVKDIQTGAGSSTPRNMMGNAAGTRMFFGAAGTATDTELWISDGDGANARRVSPSGVTAAYAGKIRGEGGSTQLYFVIQDSEEDRSVWRLELDSGEAQPIFSYQAPPNSLQAAVSPDGGHIAYVESTGLSLLDVASGETRLLLASGDRTACVNFDLSECHGDIGPQWSPDGVLYYVSDKSGWWNLYCWQNGSIHHLLEKEAEFGLPQWIFGMSTYAFDDSSRLVCTYFEKGAWKLALLNTNTRQFDNIDLPFTHFDSVKAENGQAVFLAGSPILANAVVSLDLKTHEFQILRKSADVALDSTYLSRPETIEFRTEQGRTAHAYFYPPQNRDYDPPEDELPPLIVKSHGGPTAATSTALELKIQFWTSRGFAVLDVNYGGSTGYGREYRQRLNDNWGIVDIDDCVNAAKYLVEKQLVDPNRTAITGGSAGGYTTLSALTFRDFFKAGASYYGVSDLEALTKDTHKFESRYLDCLIGAYPEMKELYIARSPIHHTGKLSCPIILFQGLEDKVVPPNQAEMMVQALRSKRLPVAYVAFEGEQHGFRKAENVKRTLEAELYFYSKIFGFELVEKIEPVAIENLQ
ncbi:S9 family peptidase, partial [candidate division KSB1 bacterium]|nr:S9 family peptidase [candidate division KSB1 bacterium]